MVSAFASFEGFGTFAVAMTYELGAIVMPRLAYDNLLAAQSETTIQNAFEIDEQDLDVSPQSIYTNQIFSLQQQYDCF